VCESNLQELNDYFENLYVTTIGKFEEKLGLYNTFPTDNTTKILINELDDTIRQMKVKEFKVYYTKLALDIFEKIRYNSVLEHTDKCVTRAVFDILFKYCLDFEYKVSHLCCSNTRFKTLQFEILRDLRWRIRA